MKKHYLTLIIAIMCVLAFAICVNGAEYTVTNDSEYQNAYISAVDGDTIIVNGNLTCDIKANKSITYVLKADWESSRLVVDQSNVEVSFIADGGNYRILPTNYSNDGWLHLAEVYKNVVINLGGKNGGTVTIDGTNATSERVSISSASTTPDITWNFFDGSAIANFNPQTNNTEGSAFIIFARTINMYAGSKIYANRIVNEPLLRATYFNMFGGEIFGNVLESKKTSSTGSGAIFVSERIMIYGGSIYKNIFNAKAKNIQNNMIGFFTTPSNKDVVVLDLSIGDTYITGNGSNEVSAMFGTTVNQFDNAKYYYNANMQRGTRYTFSGTPILAYDEQTGKNIWQVSSYTLQSENWTGRGWTRTDVPGNNMAAFLNAEKKVISGKSFDTYSVINAYIGTVYAYSGSKVIAIPNGYELWSTSSTEYCHNGRAYTLSEVNSTSIILYSAYNAGKTTVNGEVVCAGGCGKAYTCLNPDHDLEVVSITYVNYSQNGVKEIKCNTCGYEDTSLVEAPALFICSGYSTPIKDRDGLAIGFIVNNEAIKEYKSVTGKNLTYGVFAASQENLGKNDVFDSNGTAGEYVVNAEITGYEFASFELRIVGFTADNKDLKLAMGAYVKITDGETSTYSYMQGFEPNEGEKYFFVSYTDISNKVK